MHPLIGRIARAQLTAYVTKLGYSWSFSSETVSARSAAC